MTPHVAAVEAKSFCATAKENVTIHETKTYSMFSEHNFDLISFITSFNDLNSMQLPLFPFNSC